MTDFPLPIREEAAKRANAEDPRKLGIIRAT